MMMMTMTLTYKMKRLLCREDDEIPEESDDDAVLDEPPQKKSLWDVVSREPRMSKSDFNRKPRVSKSDFHRKPRVSTSGFNSKGKSWQQRIKTHLGFVYIGTKTKSKSFPDGFIEYPI